MLHKSLSDTKTLHSSFNCMNLVQKTPVGASFRAVVNWLVIEYHDVSPGKASFPDWLQVFIAALMFVSRISLTPPGRAQRHASGEHIWASCERGCCWSRGRGGNWKTKDPPESIKGSRCPEQTSGGISQWTSKPRKCQLHRSDLLTWYMRDLVWVLFKHIGSCVERSQVSNHKFNFLRSEWAETKKVMKLELCHSSKKNKAPKPSRSN